MSASAVLPALDLDLAPEAELRRVHAAIGPEVGRGVHRAMFVESAPEHSWQGGTAVRVEHRNHGLGRWLKASAAERVIAERPRIRFVDTENAYSNEPMLHINIAMGFEIIKTVNDWQAPVAAVRSALEEKP